MILGALPHVDRARDARHVEVPLAVEKLRVFDQRFGALREALVLAGPAGSMETLANDVWEETGESAGYVVFRFALTG